jgi:hypothetical protein
VPLTLIDWFSQAMGVQVAAAAAGALETLHSFVVPRAGSLPKKALVHWPLPVTVFVIHEALMPKRTVCVPLTLKGWFSTAMRVHASLLVSTLASSHFFVTPGSGSLPKNALVHGPLPLTERVIHDVPAP